MSKLHSHPLRFGGMTLCNIFEEEKKKLHFLPLILVTEYSKLKKKKNLFTKT